MELTELTVPLVPHKDIKTPKEPGVVHLKLLFRPGFLLRSRKSTSTFSAAGRVGTGLVGGVVGGVGGGVGAVAHVGGGAVKGVAGGVGTVGKGVFGGIKRVVPGGHGRRASNGDIVTPGVAANESAASPAELQGLGLPVPPSESGAGPSPPSSAGISTVGSLTITVDSLNGAGDVSEKKAIVVKSGSKTLKETKAHSGDVLDVIPYSENIVVKTGDGPFDLSFSVV